MASDSIHIHVLNQSPLMDLAVNALTELMQMVHMGEPLWIMDIESNQESLNYENYLRAFPHSIEEEHGKFVYEATRETDMLIISGLELVELFLDAKLLADMFPNMIASVTTIDTISGGTAGTRDGTLQLMKTEFQILSPLVPIRDVSFLRFCKHVRMGVWAVVDVSINGEFQSNSRRFPSGFIVQDMPNGCSKVTWVEHTGYDESAVHTLYRSMLRSGLGLGARCWISTLQRRTEGLDVLLSLPFPFEDPGDIMSVVGSNMLTQAHGLVASFCAGMCESPSRKWAKHIDYNMSLSGAIKVMSKQADALASEPPGIVVSACTTVWLDVLPQWLFSYLRGMSHRSAWDVFCEGLPVKEIIHLRKGSDEGNVVSLLHAYGGNGGNGMLMIQETCTDASGSMVVYSPVPGGEVPLLPCGFFIQPHGSFGGSLLTVAFQQYSALETLDLQSVERIAGFIEHAIFAIKTMHELYKP